MSRVEVREALAALAHRVACLEAQAARLEAVVAALAGREGGGR